MKSKLSATFQKSNNMDKKNSLRIAIMSDCLTSKFDLPRVARAVNAVNARCQYYIRDNIIPELLGYCDKVGIEELGETTVAVFRNEDVDSRISTIVVRGATDNLIGDIERAIDDNVNNLSELFRDGRYVPGARATGIELATHLAAYADTLPGLEQYAVRKFAVALKVFSKALAENI